MNDDDGSSLLAKALTIRSTRVRWQAKRSPLTTFDLSVPVRCIKYDLSGIIFMGPFPVSYGNSYILLTVDYVSRWVEARATKANDAKTIVEFMKSNIFYRLGVPKALISDQGCHFCNYAMATLLKKYGVVHRVATVYYPQTNDQVEVFNREIKKL
ncbi:Pro-Pol polyprotein, partial [Mucuna pruriens]